MWPVYGILMGSESIFKWFKYHSYGWNMNATPSRDCVRKTHDGTQLPKRMDCGHLPSLLPRLWLSPGIMFSVVAVAFMMLAEDKWDLHRLKLLGSMSFQALLGLNVVLFAVTKLGTKELLVDSTKLIILCITTDIFRKITATKNRITMRYLGLTKITYFNISGLLFVRPCWCWELPYYYLICQSQDDQWSELA